ncbi:MAG: DUF1775 domain-containing protein [Phenylobacterium sp.]
MRRSILVLLAALLVPGAASAHVTVWPRQSGLGERERYVIRAPNEKRVATLRIEAQFPPEVRVTSFEQKPGWKIEPRRDAAGAIVGAAWSGELAPDQFAEFGVMAVNPKAGETLTWTFTQVYADGSQVRWSGPPGSATPAPQVRLLPFAAGEGRR